MPFTPEGRLNRVVIAMILAAVCVMVSLAVDHFSGIYEPSEVTGRKRYLLGVLGSAVLIGWVVVSQGSGERTTLVKRFLRGLSVAFAAALTSAISQYAYFILVWGDFSSKMGEFTRRTLTGRGAPAEYVNSFAATVEKSWQTPRVAANSFLRYLVWGGIVAFVLAAVSSGVGLIRASKQRQIS